jgi:undecaprenyl diphosphate synthase
VDARTDGRVALAEAVEALRRSGAPITEASIAAAMNAPAEADPDLVVVLGSAHRLPLSLVWELAYSELVFLDVDWPQLTASHLVEAIDSFAHRHRRFGGID